MRHSKTRPWTDKQLEAMEKLACGERVDSIETGIGVSRATFHRWRADPDFIEAVNILVQAKQEEIKNRTIDSGYKAVECLRQISENENIHPGIRIRAAIAILDNCKFYLRETEEAPEMVEVQARSITEERSRLKGLSPEELAKEYEQMIINNGKN